MLDILSNKEQKQLFAGLICSLLLHGLILSIQKKPFLASKPIKIIEIELVKPEEKNQEKKQIVSKPELVEEKPRKLTNLLSEQDSSTVVEQIRRGDLPIKSQPAVIEMPKPKALPKQEEKIEVKSVKEEKKAPIKNKSNTKSLATKKLAKEDLFLSKNDIFEKIESDNKSEQDKKVEVLEKKLANYKPFSRNFSSQSPTLRYGNPDFLPNIQDGEITLLNTKAERYAIFVRRVALQVFGSLRRFSWQELSASEINSIRGLNTIHARLSKTGELKAVTIKVPSGSRRFDLMVQKAAENGAWDKNPPEGVTAEDGDIHFIFKARSWARPGADGFNEQRWLLLSTGLL